MAEEHVGAITMTSAEALEAFRRVKLSGSTALTVVYADAGEEAFGVTAQKVATETPVAIELLTKGKTVKIEAAAAIAACNSALYGADDGKVSGAVNGVPIAQNLAVASGDGSVIECLLADRLEGSELFVGKTRVATAVDLTLTAADHSGAVIDVTADAGTDTKITLPVGVVGMDFVIRNEEADAGNLLQVDLNGNEIIEGANLTIAATKLANLTKATSKKGDYIHLVCNVAATSWRCVSKRGTWVTSA